jgi:hypothetical protein
VRIRFTPEARLSIREKRAWWEANRDKAPTLFAEELAAAIVRLRDGADVSRQRYAVRHGQTIWRLLLPKTRHHVYYQTSEELGVIVLLVWNAIAEAPPEL